MCTYLSKECADYPSLLKQLPNFPNKLFYKGKLDSSIFSKCLAVIGSRKATSYGKIVTEKLIKECVKHGITIVSGFSNGIDEAAHRETLAAGGKTISVVPFGIDYMRLGTRYSLYAEIIKKDGLILSEYPADYSPQKWMFIKRNRIVAGLCQAILVIEASVKSGTFITVAYGREYNRNILAVPGPINSKYSEGTLKLLREGAVMVQSIDDILTVLKLKKISTISTGNNGNGVNLILKLLRIEPLTTNELVEKSRFPVSKINQELSLLSIEGLVQEIGGKYYACKD